MRNPSRLVGDDFVLVVFQLGTNCFEFSDTLPLWKKSQLGLLTPSGFPFFFFLGKGYKFVQCIKSLLSAAVKKKSFEKNPAVLAY